MRAHSMKNSNQLFKVIELLQEIFYRIVLATLSWREKKNCDTNAEARSVCGG